MIARGTVAVWGLFGAIATGSALLVMRRPPEQRLSDLHIYYGAARTVADGQPLYGYVAENGGPFTYPPFAVLPLRLLAAVPEGALQVLWMVLTCAAVAAIAVTVGATVTGGVADRRRPLVVAAVACAVLLSAPAQSNLRFGQVSVFIVLLALLDGVGVTPARWRGVLVGVAAAVKLTPLLFVVYFVVAGRWRDAARAVAAFVACAAVGALVLPADSWQYWSGTMLRTSRIGDLASLGNQSVHGALMRIGVPPGALPVLWAVLVAAICAAALLRARRLDRDGERTRAAVLVGCATVAASPVSWTHHQVWTVLAAMLLIATSGAARRVAGALLLVAMTVSLGVVFGDVSTYPGVQFLLENARMFGAVAVCVAGCGGVAAAAVVAHRRGPAALRTATVAGAVLACFALLPLPAGADPTFKAYTHADAGNPRYFYFSPGAALTAGAPVRFGVLREKTKVRVNGVVSSAVARLEYRSAPGGAPRDVPLLALVPGPREFSFRSANLAAGRLVAYDATGRVLATYTNLS
ncbi:glycosyltransferase 87 family protein [Actinomycetes bacterium KLBMP 9797]